MKILIFFFIIFGKSFVKHTLLEKYLPLSIKYLLVIVQCEIANKNDHYGPVLDFVFELFKAMFWFRRSKLMYRIVFK